MDKLEALLVRAETVLSRLETLLPPAPQAPDWTAPAFVWRRQGAAGWLAPIHEPHTLLPGQLTHVERQREQLIQNTRQFVRGRPANNVLLTGARGTGKTSLIKTLLPLFADQGLRLIEVDKDHLADLPMMVDLVAGRPERFILFCDDLSFEAGDDGYKALKVALDGGIARRAANLLVYATSNRRHLLPERQADNLDTHARDGEIHPGEAIEEKISLSDRFGLWLSFYPFDQQAYLDAVRGWLAHFAVEFDAVAERAALQWSLTRGGRSGRVAWQFACDWAGRSKKERKVWQAT
ncbi:MULTISPECIES: ATP-binding protein [unclassified Paludibacterium]|uniref:ATP-binding protein n=1 Tax=unclassified Paludibacterium TaxID=2618429 RepID=UPI001C04490B|nr:ATP-binding protein [Paludibacterium sp. B53371]BEV73496.1 ATP-binding protein [Paludibacterium sp. THUN1379]